MRRSARQKPVQPNWRKKGHWDRRVRPGEIETRMCRTCHSLRSFLDSLRKEAASTSNTELAKMKARLRAQAWPVSAPETSVCVPVRVQAPICW